MVGLSIAHYEITAKLGQGGMGEVYRATDSKLDREVAIKVLPSSVAADRERLARFEREAKVLASLNHPNIAGILGFEQGNPSHALILELVEGEDLSTRLSRGALNVQKALEVGKQVAEALEAAHRKGIIHRDLKPGNIKMDAEGRVKVLDFGLAKALADESDLMEQGERTQDESPTLTDVFTQPGTILGTAAYMSPEQARGKPLDERSDIWAFGCVLFECLSGEKAFPGEDVTEILAGIIKGEPRWAALPDEVPPLIEHLLRKCLNKDRNRRLHDIADARIEIEEMLANSDPSMTMRSSDSTSGTFARRGVHPAAALGGVVAAVLVTVALMWPSPKEDPVGDSVPSPGHRQIPIFLGMEGSLSRANGAAARLSPDGSTLAYLYSPTGARSDRRIHLRRLDELETSVLDASNGAIDFRFSPDGEWVVFRQEGGKTLKKISVTAGGDALVVVRTDHGRGMDWSDDGWIVYSAHSQSVLFRALASGQGEPEPVTQLAEGELTHRWPHVLPGGKAVIFTAHKENSYGYDQAKIMAQDLPRGEHRELVDGGFHGRYLSSGHLVYVRDNSLFARAFDPEALEVLGPEVRVVQDVATSRNGVAHYDVSAAGDLVYLKGGYLQQLYTFEWVDRDGTREAVPYADAFKRFRLSPNGRYLAASILSGDSRNLWIYDLEKENRVRLTFDSTDDDHPVWSPTGGSIVFSRRDPNGFYNLYWIRTDDAGNPQRLTEGAVNRAPNSWSRDGRSLVVSESGTIRPSADIRVAHLEGDDASGWSISDTTDFRATPFFERNASLSPDGRWLAYVSDETDNLSGGRVFVRSFPDGGKRKQISTAAERSVSWVRWFQEPNELVFGNFECYSASFRELDDQLSFSQPVQWNGVIADEMFNQPSWGYETYDLDPNRLRVLVRKQAQDEAMEETRSHIVLFENFLDYLRENVPVSSAP